MRKKKWKVRENMSKTFTDKLAISYEKACEENKGIDKEFFYCATPKGGTKRNLDLSANYVFCKNTSTSKKDRPEYRLEAYMVKKALQDKKRFLPIKNKRWELIDAERNIAKADIVGKGGKKLDILAYEEETNTYVILELKVRRILLRAKEELNCYCKTLNDQLSFANKVYKKDAKNVCGYIVWPAPENHYHSKEYSEWGIIEYSPKELEALKRNPNKAINFEIKQDPKCD